MILGIGSRIKHPKYGVGVVTNLSTKMYWINFIEKGIETVAVDDDMEVIETVEGEEECSFN